jgi:hypothetical protein
MRQVPLTFLTLSALCFTAFSHVYGQAATSLTTKDHVEIQQLANQYAIALDTRSNDGNTLADLFTADGELVGLRGTAKGRAELAALARRGIMTAERPVVDVSHFTTNHVIQPSAGGATGREYVVLVNFGPDDKPGGDFASIGGHYEDTYAKTPAGWRFKRREYVAARPVARPPQALTSSPGSASPTTTPTTRLGTALTADDYIAIRALANSSAYGLDTGADGRLNVRHFLTNHLIEASPEGARGKVYVMVFDIADGARPTSVVMGGHFEDVYEKTTSGWRIKSRTFFSSKSAQTLKAEAEAAAARQAPPK